MKKFAAFLMALTMAACMTACSARETTSGSSPQPGSTSAQPAAEDGGTIMLLSSVSSGPTYDALVSILEGMGTELGYDINVVYGDPFNDPAGNLTAVKNGMTDQVKALIMMQDGGVQNIMEEYPDLYVAGYTTTMGSVYGEGGASAAVKDSDHFLGTVAGDYVDAAGIGKLFADKVIADGYRKVSTMIFPEYAYPEMAVKDMAFRETIAAYNETVGDDEKIEVVGDAHVLEFAPLDDAYFMESNHSDLDCIAAFCDPGFVYSSLINARDMGTIGADTKLLAVGYLDDANFQADIGGEGTVQMIYTASPESITYCIALIDNALHGMRYSDHTASEAVDSPLYIIESEEDIQNVVNKSVLGTADFSTCGVTPEQLKNVLLRFNADATYADLMELMGDESMTVERFK